MTATGGARLVNAGRSTFQMYLDWRLMTNAFLDAAKRGVSLSTWLERAVAQRLDDFERSRAPNPAEVEWFCKLAEDDPDRIPAHMRGAYDAVNGDDWDRYWITPRFSRDQLEDGSIPEAAQWPYLSRCRVSEDWWRLLGSCKSVPG